MKNLLSKLGRIRYMKKFTAKELARYNGKNGKPSYVAYDGKIYDVSNSFLWKDGIHQVLHRAGADLTDAIKQAPHGEGSVLQNRSIVIEDVLGIFTMHILFEQYMSRRWGIFPNSRGGAV